MANKGFRLGMLVMVPALIFVFSGCDDGSTGGGGNKTSPFEGTWVSGSISLPLVDGNGNVFYQTYTNSEITFTGTTWQSKATGGPSGYNYCFGKGTFVYTNTTITCTPTHGYVGTSSTPNWISANYAPTETYTINNGALIGLGAVFQRSNWVFLLK
jgi:hypothetical protein